MSTRLNAYGRPVAATADLVHYSPAEPGFIYSLSIPGGGTWHEGYYEAILGEAHPASWPVPYTDAAQVTAAVQFGPPPPGETWPEGSYTLHVTRAGGYAWTTGQCVPWAISFWVSGDACATCDTNQDAGGPGQRGPGFGDGPQPDTPPVYSTDV